MFHKQLSFGHLFVDSHGLVKCARPLCGTTKVCRSWDLKDLKDTLPGAAYKERFITCWNVQRFIATANIMLLIAFRAHVFDLQSPICVSAKTLNAPNSSFHPSPAKKSKTIARKGLKVSYWGTCMNSFVPCVYLFQTLLIHKCKLLNVLLCSRSGCL